MDDHEGIITDLGQQRIEALRRQRIITEELRKACLAAHKDGVSNATIAEWARVDRSRTLLPWIEKDSVGARAAKALRRVDVTLDGDKLFLPYDLVDDPPSTAALNCASGVLNTLRKAGIDSDIGYEELAKGGQARLSFR